MLRGRFGQAISCYNPQMRRIVLQQNEHDRAQGHYPEQLIAELGTRRHVGGPISGIDKAHGNEQSGPQEAQGIQGTGHLLLLSQSLAELGKNIHGGILILAGLANTLKAVTRARVASPFPDDDSGSNE